MRWDGSYKVVSLLGSELDLKSLKIFDFYIFIYFWFAVIAYMSLKHKYLAEQRC